MNMIKSFIQTFDKLPKSNKAMVYLMWIFYAWSLISNIFVNIYVFKINNSLFDSIIYNIIFISSKILWFSWIWYIMSLLKKDIKNMYYVWYIFFILSFILLLIFKWNIYSTYIFWLFYWLWAWSFRMAVHSQELKNIKNETRDFYSSSISTWKNLISIIIPILVAFIFFLWDLFKFDWYFVLFFILPFVYITSFLFINKIDSYIPKKIRKIDIKNFFNLKKYFFWHLYFFIW